MKRRPFDPGHASGPPYGQLPCVTNRAAVGADPEDTRTDEEVLDDLIRRDGPPEAS